MQGEYRGDFTRDTFYAANHFCRVLMQQGRVQLDADWNEQAAILLYFLRSLARDLIGQHGGPGQNLGFNIQPLATPGAAVDDLLIGAGHYYVDGILCELGGAVVSGSFPAQSPNPPTSIVITPSMAGNVNFQNGQWIQILYVKTTDGTNGSYFANITAVSSGTLTITGITPAYANDVSGSFQVRLASTFLDQTDYPNPNLVVPQQSIYVVYLDAWERHVVSAQDDSIREVALGGPDTASRAQVVCQVKLFVPPSVNNDRAETFTQFKNSIAPKPNAAAVKVNIPDATWQAFVNTYLLPPNRGLLAAQIPPQAASTDPCVISPQSAYRGAENQLYRVEIQTGTDQAGDNVWNGATDANGKPQPPNGAVTFKWSRENGSVVFPILKLATTASSATSPALTTVSLANLGRDSRLSLNVNDWVEIVDDASDLSVSDQFSLPGPLLQVQSVDLVNMVVTLAGTTAIVVDQPPTRHPLLRRWDQQQGDGKTNNLNLGVDGGALLAEGVWLTLEDGIQIQFQSAPSGQVNQYRSGDYWLIPARVATGNIEWPQQTNSQGQSIPAALPPHGIGHHYAPLALISATNAITDLRRVSQPLAQ
jgi:Family of unknown function (DUF6519)